MAKYEANSQLSGRELLPGVRRFRTRIQNQRSSHGPSHLTCLGLLLCDVIKGLGVTAAPAQKVAEISMNWIPAFEILLLALTGVAQLVGASSHN